MLKATTSSASHFSSSAASVIEMLIHQLPKLLYIWAAWVESDIFSGKLDSSMFCLCGSTYISLVTLPH